MNRIEDKFHTNPYDDIADMYNYAMNFGFYDFSLKRAPKILEFYRNTPIANSNKNVLDLGCGTGLISIAFLKEGYNVTGIDKSIGMIRNAKSNLEKLSLDHIDFIEGDATNFKVEKTFGLVISLFSVMNHMDSEEELKKSFQCVYNSLDSDGYFIFDIFTDLYFDTLDHIKVIEYDQNEHEVFFIRQVVNLKDKVKTKITCFFKDKFLYKKYTNDVIFSRFNIDNVLDSLKSVGFKKLEVLSAEDFTPVNDRNKKLKQLFIRSTK